MVDIHIPKKMRIGIYGSSFDPVTNVHLWTASTIMSRKRLDKVILLPCSGKRGDKDMKTSDIHRLTMLELATKDNSAFEVDQYEMNALPGEHYTYFTMKHFIKEYPEADLYFIIGADLLGELSKWKYGEELIKTTKFIVMARNGINMLEVIAKDPLLRNNDDDRFHLVDKGLVMEISSTYIRDEIKLGGNPRYLLPENCYEYMIQNELYM